MLAAALSSRLKSRASLLLEKLTLRHPIGVLQRPAKKPPGFATAPRFLRRDRDRIFGDDFTRRGKAMGIREVLAAPRSPWQRTYVERVIGSIHRGCLDHVIIVSEASLHRILNLYLDYYHASRTLLSLEQDSQEPRPVQPPEMGRVVAVPQVGGLHHRYQRRAA